MMEQQTQWKENVILIDADYADRLVFDISVQLERMLERPMPKVEISRWCDYLSLDGGLRPGNNSIQVLFVYSKQKATLQNFIPSSLATEVDAHSFRDNLGEFSCASFPVEEELVSIDKLYIQSVETLLTSSQIKRLLLVADIDAYGNGLKEVLPKKTDKDITLFVCNPQTGFHCSQEVITYSLMAALGIKGEELS
ncbi:MAG: DUF6621 family protein [Bacteroidaceae bacterium]|nr:DUF6621 family protein [Bacteroidaceae bacterium]